MEVTVVGANGKTGRLLVHELASAGHRVRAMVRREQQRAQFDQDGVVAVLGDLEGEFRPALEGSDAVVFAAGSGSHTGADKTLVVDLLGAVRTIDACRELGVRRYVMLSSIRADDPRSGREQIRHYLAAKHAADRILATAGLDHTIVRPGRLTDDPATGQVRVGAHLERGEIPRSDVAAVLAACIDEPATIGAAFDLVAGDTDIREALQAV